MYNCFKKDPSRHFSVAGTVAHRRWNGKEGKGGGGRERQVGTQREQSAPQPEIEIFSLFFLLFGFRLCPRDGRGKGARVVDLVSTTTTSGTHALNPEKSQKEERWSFQEIISFFFFFLFCSFWFFTDERITRQRTQTTTTATRKHSSRA
jgi:hypothetical protein